MTQRLFRDIVDGRRAFLSALVESRETWSDPLQAINSD